jgi:UDP-N-acetylglucosamine 2-epimerase (non-hydrolysing)
MVKNLFVFGTRPEAIKMAPLVMEFQKSTSFETRVCVTAQHREMLDQVLDFFEIKPDYDLNLMKPNQNLFTLSANILLEFKSVLEDFKPDFVYVHGDTTTSMVASLASFYSGCKVCHIEAGLRTNNKMSPFPEELNRQITGRIADYHFVPTIQSRNNLIQENISEDSILMTGNTVIDALFLSISKLKDFHHPEIEYLKSIIDSSKKLILVTGHRRENHGRGFVEICEALKIIAEGNDNIQVIYPVHLNPNVRNVVFDMLSGIDNINLINPLAYPAFVFLMNQAYLILTDSGGIQEEAPSIGKPVLLMRDTTERPESVDVGAVILVGTNKKKIVEECLSLIENTDRYSMMSSIKNPYGSGDACKRIINFMKNINN